MKKYIFQILQNYKQGPEIDTYNMKISFKKILLEHCDNNLYFVKYLFLINKKNLSTYCVKNLEALKWLKEKNYFFPSYYIDIAA